MLAREDERAARRGAVLATLSDAFLASFGSDDPNHAARLDGLAQMKRGYGGMLFAAQQSLPQ